MTTAQWEVRKRVIENAGIQVYDIGVPALVIRVTAHTLAVFSRREQTVKSAPDLAVIADVLVTCRTERRTRGVGVWRMACRAVIFDVRVTFDNAAWHHQSLEHLRMGLRHRAYREARQQHRYSPSTDHIEYICTAMTCTIAVMINKKKNGR